MREKIKLPKSTFDKLNVNSKSKKFYEELEPKIQDKVLNKKEKSNVKNLTKDDWGRPKSCLPL